MGLLGMSEKFSGIVAETAGYGNPKKKGNSGDTKTPMADP